jgi:RHS repeat-associated protein
LNCSLTYPTASFAEADAETSFNNFELRQYDPVTGRWMTTDPFAQYHSPYLAMGNNPINMIDPTGGIAWDCIVEAILKALTQASKFVATNANSITSLISIAAQGSVASLVGGIDYQTGSNINGIDNTKDAFDHYYNGNGQTASIGENTIKEVITDKEFLRRHDRIVNGKTTSMEGDFSIDLTFKVIHIGRTNVGYSITCASGVCKVTYNLFENDGFWDVDVINEKTLGNLGVPIYIPDGLGPNLEQPGGTPYEYKPARLNYVFPDPGY